MCGCGHQNLAWNHTINVSDGKKDRQSIKIPRPIIVKENNANMEGIDVIGRRSAITKLRRLPKNVPLNLYSIFLSVHIGYIYTNLIKY